MTCWSTLIFLGQLISLCFRCHFLQLSSLLLYWHLRWFMPRLLPQRAVHTVPVERGSTELQQWLCPLERGFPEHLHHCGRPSRQEGRAQQCPKGYILLQECARLRGCSPPAPARRERRAGLVKVRTWICLPFPCAEGIAGAAQALCPSNESEGEYLPFSAGGKPWG